MLLGYIETYDLSTSGFFLNHDDIKDRSPSDTYNSV